MLATRVHWIQKMIQITTGFAETSTTAQIHSTRINQTWTEMDWETFAMQTMTTMECRMIPTTAHLHPIQIKPILTTMELVMRDTDRDGDGVLDNNDQCPSTPPGQVV